MGKLLGIKLWGTVQMIPWSFFMGNHMCRSGFVREPTPPVGIIKLIKSDGFVRIYGRPIKVSELMAEFPKHKVCSSDSFCIGQKIPALSEDDQLQLGNNYFLLPSHFFQSVLSFVTIASFAASKNAKAASCQLFKIQKTESGCLKIQVTDEFISHLMDINKVVKEEEESLVCTTPQLQKDYKQLVGARLRWKPKLEMIRETRNDQKKNRKVLLPSFRVKRSGNKSRIQNNKIKSSKKSETHHEHVHHHQHVPSSSTTTLPSNGHKLKSFSKLKRH